jgi:hypothetical protein
VQRPHLIVLLVLAGAASGARPAAAQEPAVGVAGRVEGDRLVLEARSAPRTRVVIGVATRLSEDGRTLALDDPLFIAASVMPELRGTTGADGVLRAVIPLDPRFRETIATLYVQAARIGGTETTVTSPSDPVAIPIQAARQGPGRAIAWLAAAAALLAGLALLPATVRWGLARAVAALALLATPVALGVAYRRELTAPPFVPYGGDVVGPLEQHLAPGVVQDLLALNEALPPGQPVAFHEFPLVVGDDLLLHRIFARRPFSVLPDLRLLGALLDRGHARPVVVTVREEARPPDAVIVFRRNRVCAWRPAR